MVGVCCPRRPSTTPRRNKNTFTAFTPFPDRRRIPNAVKCSAIPTAWDGRRGRIFSPRCHRSHRWIPLGNPSPFSDDIISRSSVGRAGGLHETDEIVSRTTESTRCESAICIYERIGTRVRAGRVSETLLIRQYAYSCVGLLY